jgi:thiosulfate/3-mercaptopyruvate sulfurtransferase
VEWKENVSGPLQTFKSADELKRLYAAKGITPDKEIVTYCASGGRASQSLFALKLLGYPKVKVYYGSWSDYTARPDAPVQK